MKNSHPRRGHDRTLDDHSHSMRLGMKCFLLPDYHLFRRQFMQYARFSPSDYILDFGCGVGLLEDFMVKRLSNLNQVIGADIGLNLLRKARARFSGCANIQFLQLDPASGLPFASETFDLIVSNLVSHLLSREQKATIYGDFKRILKKTGRLVMAEIGRPTSFFGKFTEYSSKYFWQKLWDYEKNCSDSYDGLVPVFLKQAGFSQVEIVAHCKGFIDFIVCSSGITRKP